MENKEKPTLKQRLSRIGPACVLLLRERGLYIVLIVCVLLVGAAVWMTYAGDGEGSQPAPEAAQAGQSDDETLPEAQAKTPVPTVTPTPTPMPDFTQTPAVTEAPPRETMPKAAPPVKGEVVWGYAANSLIFSETLSQWMTHPGIDIASPVGSEVCCFMGGVVDEVTEDASLGFMVIMKHEDDMTTIYANLDEDIPVKTGQKLNAGDTIGSIGRSAASELELPPHLHFELWRDGSPVDPLTVMELYTG